MAWKSFRVELFSDFIKKADDYDSDKLYDTETRIATFYGYNRKKYEYEMKDDDSIDTLLKRGFIKGHEIDIREPW